MLRYVPPPIRQRLRKLARSAFGVDVSFAANYSYNRVTYEGSAKLVRRLLHFERLLQQVEDVDGRIVECGVGPGRSIFAFSLLSQFVTRPREIWGFDTFEGIPPPTSEDGEDSKHKAGWWAHPQEEVEDLLQFNGLEPRFIRDHITFVPGLFNETLPHYGGAPIALLHLDIDFYESYKTALKFLWPHIAEGGIVAFDEYHKPVFPGATLAVDEFFADRPEYVVKSPVVDLYYVVKRPSIDGE